MTDTLDFSFKIKDQCFYPLSKFPHLRLFEANFKAIKKELEFLISRDFGLSKDNKVFQPWIEYDLYNESNPNGWDIAPFMINGKMIEKNCDLAPYLNGLIKTIPGLVSVSYSLLKPNTHIVPHQGYDEYSEQILRYHMGVIIPKGDLGIRVGNELKTWREGESFIFDDFLIHEAWNFSNEDRYVLICDFNNINKTEIKQIKDKSFNNSVKTYVNLN